MIHDSTLIEASRDAFAPAVDAAADAEAYAAELDQAERLADLFAGIAIILVLLAFVLPLILRGGQ